MRKRQGRGVRRVRPGGTWQGINRGLRGRGGLIAFLATAGVLGILSGFALAAPGGRGSSTHGVRVHSADRARHAASVATDEVTTTVTGPATTLTTTIPCAEQTQREVITPPSLSTVTGEDTTVTETLPDSSETITEPGSTETISQDGTTQTVTEPDSTISQTEPGSTIVRTVPGPAVVTTVPGTTETVTDCTSSTITTSTQSTGAVLGTSASGGTTTKLAIERSKRGGKKKGGASDPVATTATGASGSLPFTGLQVPALILIGIGMGAAGLVLRRRVGSLD